jgi:hypothetical protein
MSGQQGVVPIETHALWTWDTSGPQPVLQGYYNDSPTKSGVTPQDVRNFSGVPLTRYGRPPVPMTDQEVFNAIRSAEDMIEQKTGLLLTPTFVASPPTRSAQQSIAAAIIGHPPVGGQIQGVDYDLQDAAYDFKFDRAKEEGWLIQSVRYRPLRILDNETTAIKKIAYIYPLLNEYFQIPVTWYVEDLDFGLVRIVPAVDVTMLPLFALQLAVQGFSNSVPGGIWMWYSAGLTPNDYQTRFGFIQELVLCWATARCLLVCQGSVNQGLDSTQVLLDGVQTQFKYRPGGAYSDLIKGFNDRGDALMHMAITAVGGPVMEVF